MAFVARASTLNEHRAAKQGSFVAKIRWPRRVTVQYWFLTLHSPVMVLQSPVLIFTQSSFNFYTVQFYFYTVNTQSSYIFCVVTRPLSLYCNLTAAILYFLATMDSIIRQAVREELRRSSSSRPETASSTNQDDQGRSENESGAAGSSRSSFSSRTVGRLGCF